MLDYDPATAAEADIIRMVRAWRRQAGDKVQLVGFGSFEVKSRAERTGRNPKTKEAIVIPASKAPAFKPGKALKDALQ